VTKHDSGVKGILTPKGAKTLAYLLGRGWEPSYVVTVRDSYTSYDGFDYLAVSWEEGKVGGGVIRNDEEFQVLNKLALFKDDQIKQEALEVTAQCLSANSVERAMELLLDFYMALHFCVNVEETEDEETIAHYMSGLKLAKQKCLGICP